MSDETARPADEIESLPEPTDAEASSEQVKGGATLGSAADGSDYSTGGPTKAPRNDTMYNPFQHTVDRN